MVDEERVRQRLALLQRNRDRLAVFADLPLEEHAVIDSHLSLRLRNLAGLRNRLVHLYDEIDDTVLRENTSAASLTWTSSRKRWPGC